MKAYIFCSTYVHLNSKGKSYLSRHSITRKDKDSQLEQSKFGLLNVKFFIPLVSGLLQTPDEETLRSEPHKDIVENCPRCIQIKLQWTRLLFGLIYRASSRYIMYLL